MGQQLHIEIYIGSKRYVKQAEQIVADMIKLYYLEGISTLDSKYEVYRSFLQKRKMLREYPESNDKRSLPDASIHPALCPDEDDGDNTAQSSYGLFGILLFCLLCDYEGAPDNTNEC